MNRHERLLYHQIHPIKLLTDIATAVAASWLLWEHRLASATVVGFGPSILVTVVLLRWGNLDRYQRSGFGRYIAGFMSRRVEAARFAGLIPLWGGAWLHQRALIAFGAAWILACWLWGLRPRRARSY